MRNNYHVGQATLHALPHLRALCAWLGLQQPQRQIMDALGAIKLAVFLQPAPPTHLQRNQEKIWRGHHD